MEKRDLCNHFSIKLATEVWNFAGSHCGCPNLVMFPSNKIDFSWMRGCRQNRFRLSNNCYEYHISHFFEVKLFSKVLGPSIVHCNGFTWTFNSRSQVSQIMRLFSSPIWDEMQLSMQQKWKKFRKKALFLIIFCWKIRLKTERCRDLIWFQNVFLSSP